MGETGGIALIPEDDIEIKSYHEGYMEGMFDNSNVLITLHQFYGDKETIIRNILSGNRLVWFKYFIFMILMSN